MIKLACQPETRGRPKHEVLGAEDLRVLHMLSRGKTRDEIANEMHTTAASVTKWIQGMRREVFARTDAHLIAIAKENGLV